MIIGNKRSLVVRKIGEFELKLSGEVRINLVNYYYSSKMSRNIIYFHALYRQGF